MLYLLYALYDKSPWFQDVNATSYLTPNIPTVYKVGWDYLIFCGK